MTKSKGKYKKKKIRLDASDICKLQKYGSLTFNDVEILWGTDFTPIKIYGKIL